MDRHTSATALGTGAVIVVAAGLGISIARTGDEGAIEPSAHVGSTTPSPSASQTPSARPRSTATPPGTTASPGSGPEAGHADARADGVSGGGRGGSRHAHRQGTTPTATELPFTGPSSLPATTAVGLLLAVAGSWTLVRVPGVPGETPAAAGTGALDRLRAPRRRCADPAGG